MISYDAKIRVNYKDTDQMGVVHHSNYIVYYEMARTEALRAWGLMVEGNAIRITSPMVHI